MKEHPNFYETVDEVRIRLSGTVILYDGKPYYVLNVANHKGDGVFRLYLDPLRDDLPTYANYEGGVPYHWGPGDSHEYPTAMDNWMIANPKSGIIRKKMNSPLFNKFRPFALGMCNYQGKALYIARSPSRNTNQGLTGNGMRMYYTDLSGSSSTRSGPTIVDAELYHTIMGQYPDPEECLKNLLDKKCSNTSVAFHREFAFIRGPLDLIFVIYRTDVVGLVLENNLTRIKLGDNFKHLREVVEQLNIFDDVVF